MSALRNEIYIQAIFLDDKNLCHENSRHVEHLLQRTEGQFRMNRQRADSSFVRKFPYLLR
jgi:hypothetical protein